ncbi:hypothetical protein M3M39_05770 [Fructilactobacillus hinvesii]|uniref:Uncharacterized protein n=1 Tax=Fructilactobacillus hinvesii TaxID=2940300 RepID=A0ABY5BVC8_9LACO|nr:hypothetical protein [Fructilactobacillus hinvesii]USS87628.1 hypothetical protein M3M39_05770 [Fructilactobacillus hinvesii]
MNQDELCSYLGSIDAKTLKKLYTLQPDCPTGDLANGVSANQSMLSS